MVSLDSWREPDLQRVTSLINASSAFDRFDSDTVRESVFGDPDFDPSLLVAARSDGEMVGVVAATARRARDADTLGEVTGYIKLLAVAPEWQRMGIGTRLLREAEERLARSGAAAVRVFGDAPSYLRPGVDFRLTPFVCFLIRHGYRFTRNAVNMLVDLQTANLETVADESRLRERGIAVRRLANSDLEAFHRYLEQDWSWSWKTEALHTLRRQPISTHIAVRDGEVIGFASHSVLGPRQFGPMGTRPDLRGQGVGGVLLKRCLVDIRDQGHATADIQWVGPIGFYAKHVGARLSQCFWQFERQLQKANATEGASVR